MFHSLKVRASQGTQYITDLRKAVPKGFRGRPRIAPTPCAAGCQACHDVCPAQALSLDPVRIDLGRCMFCNECVLACPDAKLAFTPETRMAATTPEGLVVGGRDDTTAAVETSRALKDLFGRSLRMRQVSAGGCNACELELNASANVNFDLQRFGIEWVASPRHADALVLTGPLTKNMEDAVLLAWEAMPDPKFLVAFGACTISGGLYASAPAIEPVVSCRRRPHALGPWLSAAPAHLRGSNPRLARSEVARRARASSEAWAYRPAWPERLRVGSMSRRCGSARPASPLSRSCAATIREQSASWSTMPRFARLFAGGQEERKHGLVDERNRITSMTTRAE